MTEQIIHPDYAPAFSVTAEGKDITAALRQSLAELTLTDNGGATAKADELQITLLSETLLLPSKGARLRVALGFNDQLTDKGWFVVSGVASSGPPRKIVIYATAAPMNAQKQPGNVLSQKTRSWDTIRLADLVKTMAGDNGLIPKVAAKLADIRIDHLDQVAESDASLLTRLARMYDAVSKPAGGYWLFLEQGAAETVSGRASEVVTITPDEVSDWSYSEGSRGSTTDKAAPGDRSEQGNIHVRYFDEADGRTKTATVEHNGPALANPYTQPEKTLAEQSARSRKTQAGRNERKMTLTGPCRLKHLSLTAESQVLTRNFGEREDNFWLAESLVFSLTSSGFKFTFNLVADIRQKNQTSQKSADKNGPDYYG